MADSAIPFYASWLRDLVASKAQLVITCRACRMERVADVLPLHHRLGPLYGGRDLKKPLTCGTCGGKVSGESGSIGFF